MEMQKLNIGDLNGRRDIDYCDSGLLFVSNCGRLPEVFIGKYLQFDLALCCREGECVVTIGGDKEYRVETNCVFVCGEGHVITDFRCTIGFEVNIVGYTWGLLEESPALGVVAWTLADLMVAKPVVEIGWEAADMFDIYFEQMRRTVKASEDFFKRELMLCNVRCMLYVFIRELGTKLRNAPFHVRECKQSKMRDFFDLLAAHKGRMRSVVDVAEALGVSPKYLSRIIVETTGLKALRIINDYTLRNIALLLRDTDIPINIIAKDMGFDNLSFFGKFVKHATGLSPSAYRVTLKKYGSYKHMLPQSGDSSRANNPKK